MFLHHTLSLHTQYCHLILFLVYCTFLSMACNLELHMVENYTNSYRLNRESLIAKEMYCQENLSSLLHLECQCYLYTVLEYDNRVYDGDL